MMMMMMMTINFRSVCSSCVPVVVVL